MILNHVLTFDSYFTELRVTIYIHPLAFVKNKKMLKLAESTEKETFQ